MRRIVIWNCKMALDRKWDALLSLRPDLAVIPECARKHAEDCSAQTGGSCGWVGENPHKGLGVFSFNGTTVDISEAIDRNIQVIAPIEVGGALACRLLAVWAKHPKGQRPGGRGHWVGPLLTGLDRYADWLCAGNAIVAGDFNNHVRWDQRGKANNHANAVRQLNGLGLQSAYHLHRGVAQGQEPEPTLHWKTQEKDRNTYHIDYCFLSRDLVGRLVNVTLGSYEDWVAKHNAQTSDHVPLIVDLGLGPISTAPPVHAASAPAPSIAPLLPFAQ